MHSKIDGTGAMGGWATLSSLSDQARRRRRHWIAPATTNPRATTMVEGSGTAVMLSSGRLATVAYEDEPKYTPSFCADSVSGNLRRKPALFEGLMAQSFRNETSLKLNVYFATPALVLENATVANGVAK
jgi:hypothetical protein